MLANAVQYVFCPLCYGDYYVGLFLTSCL